MTMTLTIIAVVGVVCFISGILVGRRHPAEVEQAVSVAKTVAADAQSIADKAR